MTDTTDSSPDQGSGPGDPEDAIEAGAGPEPGDFVDEGVTEEDRLDEADAEEEP